jgi:hypothetical protein
VCTAMHRGTEHSFPLRDVNLMVYSQLLFLWLCHGGAVV